VTPLLKLVSVAKEKHMGDVFWIALAWLVAIAMMIIGFIKIKLFIH
jgi:hypothetical protein